MIREMIDLNRYLHDFTSAMFVCGAIMMWLSLREIGRCTISGYARRTILEVGRKAFAYTIPSLVISLISGGVRASTFAQYEHVGPVTQQTIVLLAVKHIFFVVVVAWGVRQHWRIKQELTKPEPTET